MESTIYFSMSALFYMIIVSVSFFNKKKIKTTENTIFSKILIICLISLISELCIYILPKDINFFPFILSMKLYLVCCTFWFAIFIEYVFIVTRNNTDNTIINYKEKYNKLYNIFIISNFIVSIIILLLPINFYNSNGVKYSYGPSVDLTFLIAGIYFGITLIFLIKNHKYLKNKGYLPIIFFVVLLIIVVIFQKINPGFLLINASFSLVATLMYFTIENPDLKLIEEIRNSKSISDKTNEEKTLFLYNMTRDIKLLIDNINNKVDNILKEDKLDIIKDKVEYIKDDTYRFASMVNDILDVSNIDSSNLKRYNDKYNIKLLLKELNTIYKDKTKKKQLDFRTSIASNIPEFLYGDALNLKKVLMIIMNNAIKNTEDGYLEFNINTIIKNDICRLVINIEDSSEGMNADKISEVLNNQNNDIEDDTLTSARKIITLIGGTIMVSSEVDKGTKITIVLDQKIDKTQTANTKITKYENALKNKKILFVDDNESSGKIINKILNENKFEYEIVTSGKQCLDKIRANEKYDIIFLDEEMPYIDGYEVITKLSAIYNFNTPVILLTKNNDVEYDDKYKEYGFADYIIKPLKVDEVIEKINKYAK